MQVNAMDTERLASIVSETTRGAIVWVYVSPKSAESYLEYTDGELIFHSSAQCKGHGVNYDLLKWFSKVVGVRPIIIRGWSSRRKLLLFPGANRDEIIQKLRNAVIARPSR
jgi:uncharacterized protein YggU (UPF0235/DUF167 family)